IEEKVLQYYAILNYIKLKIPIKSSSEHISKLIKHPRSQRIHWIDYEQLLCGYYKKNTIKKIKDDLKRTNDKLINISTIARHKEIEDATNIYSCLTKIIYEYQYFKQ